MKKILATAVLALAFIGSAFAATLKPYTSPKGDFTVSTPAPFKVSSTSAKTNDGSAFTSSDYSAKEDNGNLLEIGTANYPFPVSQETLDTVVANMISELHGEQKGEAFTYTGGTVRIVTVPDGQILIYSKAVGSEAFILVFFSPQSQIQTSGDEVADIISSFTTTAKK